MELGQQLSYRPIMWYWVWNWFDGFEPKVAIGITFHHAPPVRTLSILVLYVVMARAVCLPYVDLHSFDGDATTILDSAENEAGFAFAVMRHCIAVWYLFYFVRVEWAQDRAFGRMGGFGMIYAIDEE